MTVMFTPSEDASRPVAVKRDFKAAISRNGQVKTHYHYWNGISGESYLHTVFPPDKLPLLVRVVVIVVANTLHQRKVLFIGQAGDDEQSIILLKELKGALRKGGNEVHVHFLADTEEARKKTLNDLEAVHATLRRDQVDMAA